VNHHRLALSLSSVALLSCALLAASAEAAVVRLATLAPDGSVWDNLLADMGADWQKATDGRVELRIYPGGVAGDEPDVVRKMRVGQLQAAALTTAGLSEIDPAFKVFGIPMYLDSYPELLAVLDGVGPVLKRGLDEKGFVLISWGHGGWVYFFSKEPVANVADLKKKKIFAWAGDDAMVQRWKAEGFHPVALAATDILTGLQTGMIDVFPSTPLIALSLQWYTVTPHMVSVGLAPLVGGMVVTKKAWNAISPEDRTKLLEVTARLEARLLAEIPKQDTTAVAEMTRRGLKIARIEPAKMGEWRTAAAGFATGMRGSIVPADILDMVTEKRDAYRRGKPKATSP
jgi:TRAP-type C4-dicarboxylate transport system substrate-binding protein